MNYSFLANIALFIVGSVFLLTGVAKVLEPWLFRNHVAALGLVKPRWIQPVSVAFIAIETAWGIALILKVFPRVLIPLTILFIVGLSALTYWSTSTGKTEDCGCYGGWFQLSPAASLVLNAFYGILMTGAWVFIEQDPTAWWQWLSAIATMIVSGALAARHLEYLKVNHRPFLELAARLKVDRRWQSEWLENIIDVSAGSKIVVFMGTGCTLCKHWLPVLKVVHYRADLPDVVGVVSTATLEAAQEYARSYSLNFPVVAVKRHSFGRLAVVLPTAALLEDGVIRQKWVGTIPRAFAEQIASGPMLIPEGSGQVLTARR